jgi:hypothetical protein
VVIEKLKFKTSCANSDQSGERGAILEQLERQLAD